MSEKESIYVPEGEDKGRIEEPKVAEEVAGLEDVARTRERELERQHEVGLTPEQERNLEVMDELRKRYPDSLEALYYDDGKLALCTYSHREWRREESGPLGKEGYEVLLTKEGQFFVSKEVEPSELNIYGLERIHKSLSEKYGKEGYGSVNVGGKDGVEKVDTIRIDFTQEHNKKNTTAILRQSADYRRSQAEKERIPEIDELLEGI